MEKSTVNKKANNNINYVHKSIIHTENISKERKHESKNLKYEYTFSPHSSIFKNYIL
jgi:hypothetical protein